MWAATIAFILLVSGCTGIAYDTTRSIQAMRRRQDRQHEAEDNAAAEARRQRENAEIRETGRRLELEHRVAQGSGAAGATDDAPAPVPPTCLERRRAMMQDAQQHDDADERTRILSNLPRCDDLPDALDRTMIAAAIAGVKPRVTACGDKAAAKGTVKVHVVVGSDGRVADVSIESAPEVELGMCVAAALRSAPFAQTRTGGAFSYPFVF